MIRGINKDLDAWIEAADQAYIKEWYAALPGMVEKVVSVINSRKALVPEKDKARFEASRKSLKESYRRLMAEKRMTKQGYRSSKLHLGHMVNEIVKWEHLDLVNYMVKNNYNELRYKDIPGPYMTPTNFKIEEYPLRLLPNGKTQFVFK